MSKDARTDATVERMAREEREELARSHGQHILDVATGAGRSRAERDRSLLDTIGRATKAKGGRGDG
jgi:ubiquinone/menaquinone biosynthesis C-methylase UbiE